MHIHTIKSGKQFIIDEEDKVLLIDLYFGILKTPGRHTEYVFCKNKQTRLYVGLLHRLVLNITDERLIDHKNGNGLDCRKDNLRISDYILNQQNRRLTKTENEVKGLQFRTDRGKWHAKITVNKKVIYLGSFINKDDAITARLIAEDKYFGENNGWGTMQKYPTIEGEIF